MKQLLIIGYIWPEPASSAAGSRMMQLIDLFLEKDYKITYACPAKFSEYAVNLEEMGIEQVQIEANKSEFDSWLKKLNPEIVMFDRFMMEEQFGWRIAENCPDALRVLDTEDLHFFRKARYEAAKNNRVLTKADLFSKEAKREIASILRCDLTLIISEAERDLLIDKFRIDRDLLLYIPFLVPQERTSQSKSLKSFEEREHFLFIGNFLHDPNWDAVLYLKQYIWPLIRKELPKAELHIYGAYATQKVEQLHNPKERFLIKGRAKEALSTIENYKVLLAPLRFGAGIKGKFIDAMLTGTPSITTTIGAEGICGIYPWNGEISNNDQEIAEAAFMLYNREKRWLKAQKNGFKIIQNRFQKESFSTNFFDTTNRLQHQLSKHRQRNFMGAMLMHHTLQSTKYMSLWIEEKNKHK
ncbi:glycosyltransferase family 4 protein [Mesonia sp.]|uniref:glycosyltransferase family 4 protein n=1 Tax=Mesonia sp. TaxID=1960830 RepID=UPI003F98C969